MRVWVPVVVILLLIPSIVSARNWRAGGMLGLSVNSVDDPAGSTEVKFLPSYLNGIATLPVKRDRRIFLHLFYNDFDLENEGNKVSGQVKSLGLNASYQWRIRYSRRWKPWAGIGLGFSQDEFKKRFLLDPGGFISKELPDREEEAVNLLINASTILKRWKMFDFGVHGQIDIPISGDITRFSVLGTILY